MSLNKQKGQMYPWVTHTWNPIRGKCPHDCTYCYMKRFKVGDLRLDEKALKDNLGQGNTIFVGSSTDMWAEGVKNSWIGDVLSRCQQYPENTYVWQSKNPKRFFEWFYFFKSKMLWGTTIETNDTVLLMDFSRAPSVYSRMEGIALHRPNFVSIEPIMDFNLIIFLHYLKGIQPSFVSIGADSQHHHLPEPPPEKIKELIQELQKFTEVKVKPNLKRLLS